MGISTYLVPFILVFIGLGCFFEFLAYLRRRWVWTAGGLRLLHGAGGFVQTLAAKGVQARLYTTPGGVLGVNLNQGIFDNFGVTGATIIFLMLIFISVIFLTNFHLGAWLRMIWADKMEGRRPPPPPRRHDRRGKSPRETRQGIGKAGPQIAGAG